MAQRSPKFMAITIAIVMVCLVVGTLLIWFFWQRQQNLENVSVIVEKVSRHYILPQTEMPALLTVEDSSKIRTDFFKDSREGDKVLIYKDNKLVLLYRPSIDRIVRVGPVSMADLSSQ